MRKLSFVFFVLVCTVFLLMGCPDPEAADLASSTPTTNPTADTAGTAARNLGVTIPTVTIPDFPEGTILSGSNNDLFVGKTFTHWEHGRETKSFVFDIEGSVTDGYYVYDYAYNESGIKLYMRIKTVSTDGLEETPRFVAPQEFLNLYADYLVDYFDTNEQKAAYEDDRAKFDEIYNTSNYEEYIVALIENSLDVALDTGLKEFTHKVSTICIDTIVYTENYTDENGDEQIKTSSYILSTVTVCMPEGAILGGGNTDPFAEKTYSYTTDGGYTQSFVFDAEGTVTDGYAVYEYSYNPRESKLYLRLKTLSTEGIEDTPRYVPLKEWMDAFLAYYEYDEAMKNDYNEHKAECDELSGGTSYEEYMLYGPGWPSLANHLYVYGYTENTVFSTNITYTLEED